MNCSIASIHYCPVKSLSFQSIKSCNIKKDLGRVVSYSLDEKALRKIWTPKIIMVVDNKHTIMGSTKKTEESKAILTQNTAINEIATNHIVLDITLAGQRLGFDSTQYVKNIMRNQAEDLKDLLES